MQIEKLHTTKGRPVGGFQLRFEPNCALQQSYVAAMSLHTRCVSRHAAFTQAAVFKAQGEVPLFRDANTSPMGTR